VLCLAFSRFVFDDWVPKKLNVELQLGDDINMEAFRSVAKCKPMEGELPMPEAEQNNEESEPELDQTLLG
jgi:ubiquitin carboxyl-terminal hydrolase 5/13